MDVIIIASMCVAAACALYIHARAVDDGDRLLAAIITYAALIYAGIEIGGLL